MNNKENSCIFEMIKEVKKGDKEKLAQILVKFKPLVKKYAYKLNYEDAESELNVFMIELMLKIPLSGFSEEFMEEKVVSYVNKSIINYYYNLLNKKHKELNCVEYDETQLENGGQGSSIENYIILKDALKSITPLQRKVIISKYYWGYNDMEIGNYLKITRQSVNRIKNRGLSNLRKYMGNVKNK